MLTPEQVADIDRRIKILCESYEAEVMDKITDFLEFLKTQPTYAAKRQAIREFTKYLSKIISSLRSKSNRIVYDTFEEYGQMSMDDDRQRFEAFKQNLDNAELDIGDMRYDGVDWEDMDAAEIRKEYADQVEKTLYTNQKLVNSSMAATTSKVDQTMRWGIAQITRLGRDPEKVVKDATNKIAEWGVLSTKYDSGYETSVNSALSSLIRDAVKKATVDASLSVGEQLKSKYYQVTAFNDCAADHVWLNGEVFSEKNLDDVYAAMERWGCRHTVYPIYSKENAVKYDLPSKTQMAENYRQRQNANRRSRYAEKHQKH